MTGMDLVRAAAMDLRDWSDDGKTAHVKYPLMEKLVKLKRALRFLALELTRDESHLVQKEVLSGTADWPAQITAGTSNIELPADYISTSALYLAGSEQDGPLSLVSGSARFQGGSTPGAYYIQGDRLVLVPPPSADLTLRLVYNAWPQLVQQPTPTTTEEAENQLAAELPFHGLFDDALQEFVTLSCANRNEYDTTMEQGMYRMLSQAAKDVAGRDSLSGLEPSHEGGLWTGRGSWA